MKYTEQDIEEATSDVINGVIENATHYTMSVEISSAMDYVTYCETHDATRIAAHDPYFEIRSEIRAAANNWVNQ